MGHRVLGWGPGRAVRFANAHLSRDDAAAKMGHPARQHRRQ